MNYTELMKEAIAAIKVKADEYQKIKEQLRKIKHKYTGEKENLSRLKTRKVNLEAKSGECLTDDTNSYEKFRVSIKKLNIEIDTSEDMVMMFENNIIPDREKASRLACEAVKVATMSFITNNVSRCESRLSELVEPICQEKDAWMEFCTDLCKENGITLSVNQDGVIPTCKHERINNQIKGFRISPLQTKG